MNIDYSKTLLAYRSYEGPMDFVTRLVHEHVLSDDYLGKKGKVKRLVIGLGKIEEQADKEMLLQSYVGKVRFKAPALYLEEKLDSFDTERAKIIAAGIITNVMLDNGTYGIREEIKRDDNTKERKFRKHLYIQLGDKKPAKDYYKGINLDAGVVNQTTVGSWFISKDQYEFLEQVGSVPYKIWEGCTEELLLKGYSLKTDWGKKKDSKGNRLSEDPILMRKRYATYADKIVNHVKRFPKFYLSAKYDDVWRVYYEAAGLDGARPHGKLWETLMIDSAEPFDLTGEDEKVLKHIIYVTLHGRISIDKANAKFSPTHYQTARSRNPIAATTEKEFGEAILLNKAATALRDYENGDPSTFMFGYDFTNSGLMMAGLSFHSKEMMKASNMGNHKTVFDSHTEFNNSYDLGLCRDDAKDLHTALLHGSTNMTLVKKIEELKGDGSITEDQVNDKNVKAYGDCVRNIATIADWGSIAVGNRQSTLRWSTPDNWKASSNAKMEGVPVRCYAASARHKEGYCQYIVVSSMPLVEDKNGYPIYDKDTELDGVRYPVSVKKRGLYARITHSADAYVLRCVVRALVNAKRPFLLKHDDYIVPPGAVSIVLQAAQEAFSVLYETNMYSKALDEIAEHSPYGIMVPTLHVGAAKNTASVSINFLSP